MNNFNKMNRRALIKHTAAMTGAASISTAMIERALAADSNIKRVIFWYVPEGCAQQAFWPANTGSLNINMNASINGKNTKSSNGSIRNYIDASQAGFCLQPLKSNENDISLYSGFKNYGVSSITEPHKTVMASALTGSKPNEGSIDQILGKHIQGSSPIPSIYSAMWGHHVHNKGANDDYMSPVRTIGGGTTGSSNWNPMDTYKVVFGNNGIPAPSGGDGVVPYGNEHAQLDMLKAMEARLEQVKCVGGLAARDKYETLLASYKQLETQTAALLEKAEEEAKNNGPDVRFNIPNGWTNTSGSRTDLSKYWNKPENFERLVDISINTTVAAMALDRTRVSIMQFSGSGTDIGPVAKDHYRVFDRTDGSGKGIPGLEPGPVNDHYMGHDPNEVRRRNQARVYRWYYGKLAQLIDKLKATPDGSGNLFDSTLVVTSSEFSMYNHRSHDMPYIIAGGLGGAVKTGQYLDCRQNGNFRDAADLFFGISQALEANLDHFGNSRTPFTGFLS